MNRRVFLLGVTGLAACTRTQQRRLNIFNWSTYVAPETIPDFEREFGVLVRYATYESNEEMLARVLSGNSGWDVVFPSNYFLQPMIENGLVEPLRHEWLPGIANLDPRFQQPAWDPELQHCIPYMFGATGILYRNEAGIAPPTSWSDMWSSRWGGKLTMLDDPAEVVGACLEKLHLPLNSGERSALERAKREALSQKKILRAYLNAEVRDQVVSGDILAAQLWATTAQQAMDASNTLRFCYPSEGFAQYADNAVILRESRRTRIAHEFINYLLRPKVAASIVVAVRTATANGAARALLPEALRNSPVLYPDAQVTARGEWFEPLPPNAQRLRDRIWTEIKAA